MAYQIRQLTSDDLEAAYRLGSVTFGHADQPMPPPPAQPRTWRSDWGAFTSDGTLAGKVVDLEQSHWFGGRLVPATGIAGVAVAPEHRGSGLSTVLLTRVLAAARDRGAVIGTLFDTTPWPYRRVGWEEVGVRQTLTLPTRSLAGIRPGDGVTLRPATDADVPVMFDIDRQVARAGSAIMDRSAPRIDTAPATVLAGGHGITVAVDASGVVQGYCTWDRTNGYRSDGTLDVSDLVALTPAAMTALLAMLGSWAEVASKLVVQLPADDPALLVSALSKASVHVRDPWMLRVIDAPAAVAARGWPPHLTGAIDLRIDDATCPWNAGSYQLAFDGGDARLEPGGTGAVEVGARGLALLYAGGTTPDGLRRAGLLTGGDATTDALLQAAMAGPVPTLRDYF